MINENISYSSLNQFINSGPMYYRKYKDKELDPLVGDFLVIGSALHCLVLEPETFEDRYTIIRRRIGGVIGRFIQELAVLREINKDTISIAKERAEVLKYTEDTLARYMDQKDNREYYEALLSDKEIVDDIDIILINKLIKKIQSHSAANELYFLDNPDELVYSEKEVIWKREGLAMRSFLDKLRINTKTKIVKINDLKTTSKPVRSFPKFFKEYGYDLQVAMYNLAAKAVLIDLNLDPNEFKYETSITVVRTIPLFEVQLRPISSETLNIGLKTFYDAINEIKWHYETDKWDHTKSYYENGGYESPL